MAKEAKTYYTYKVTSPDSNKYYCGVSHVKKEYATVQDCLDHRYYGSGGRSNTKENQNKFVNWKRKYSDALTKEIIEIFNNKDSAYDSEKTLIKDLWKTGPECLNSRAGGVNTGNNNSKGKFSIKTCENHGDVTHAGDKCATCTAESSVNWGVCEVHGKAKFAGILCQKCKNNDLVMIKLCETHGESKHRGNTCVKCSKNAFKPEMRGCEKHGYTEHLGSSCRSCLNERVITRKDCGKHGLTKHHGESCYKCITENYKKIQECQIHGLTIHFGDTCATCTTEKSVTLRDCAIHGPTKHQGEKCYKCKATKSVSIKICGLHGEVKHRGKSCCNCIAEKTSHTRNHKETIESCRFCI